MRFPAKKCHLCWEKNRFLPLVIPPSYWFTETRGVSTSMRRIEDADIPNARFEIIPLARFDEIKSAIETALQVTYDSTKGLIGGSVVQLVGDRDLDIPVMVVELWNQYGTQKIY